MTRFHRSVFYAMILTASVLHLTFISTAQASGCAENLEQGADPLTDEQQRIIDKFSALARDEDGDVIYMRQAEADYYCRQQHQRLPNDYEIAELQKAFGAEILDTDFKNVPTWSISEGVNEKLREEIIQRQEENYSVIYNSVKSKTFVEFYFKKNDDQRLPADFEEFGFWSSSERYVEFANAMGQSPGLCLTNEGGRFLFRPCYAVRCVAD